MLLQSHISLKSCGLLTKIAISDIWIYIYGATFILKIADLKLRTAEKNCGCGYVDIQLQTKIS
jgi:hypothetical protein